MVETMGRSTSRLVFLRQERKSSQGLLWRDSLKPESHRMIRKATYNSNLLYTMLRSHFVPHSYGNHRNAHLRNDEHHRNAKLRMVIKTTIAMPPFVG